MFIVQYITKIKSIILIFNNVHVFIVYEQQSESTATWTEDLNVTQQNKKSCPEHLWHPAKVRSINVLNNNNNNNMHCNSVTAYTYC